MSTRYERIKLLIENSGKSYQELERITGIKKSSLQRYASGTTAKIPLDVIEKLSKAFNVSQEYLMGWTEDSKDIPKISPDEPKLTEGEKMLLDLFRQIPSDAQKMYLEVLRAALKNQS
jgi:transcriptional regulator with XRE-family HTH domain